MAEYTLSSPTFRRYAVLGAGFAGVSVAWHLLQFTSVDSSVSVDVYDKCGVACGASGASGGLLHPYSPSGKLLWKGTEAFEAALRLLGVAEQSAPNDDKFCWRRGILRPLLSNKHAVNSRKNVVNATGGRPELVNGMKAEALLPGLALPEDVMSLHIVEGVNIDPKRYLEALWSACHLFANTAVERGCSGTKASLLIQNISSLHDFASGDYDAVIICLGAGVLPELQGKLPLLYCRGVVGEMQLPEELNDQFGTGASPCLLSPAWLAFQGQRKLLLGATKEWVPVASMSEALPEALSSIAELLQRAEQLYPRIRQWELTGLRAGVRAMPPRTPLGALPLVACLDDVTHPVKPSKTRFWLFTGLGSRGLLYHAWVGSRVARAVVSDDEEMVPVELRIWKRSLSEEAAT